MPSRHGPEPTWDQELTRLIQHRRDREAAELVLPLLNELVAPLDDTQLDAPTPCANFAVRHVLAASSLHLIPLTRIWY